MKSLLFTRVLRGVLVAASATFLTALLLRLAPGSLAYAVLGESATPSAVAELEHALGLDRSLIEQYGSWLSHAVTGDLGSSVLTGQSVLEAVLERLPVTLELVILAQVIALGFAIPSAVAAASRHGGTFDRVTTGLSSAALSIPAFVAAPVLVYVFAVNLGWFPVTGWAGLDEGLAANLQSALLPAFAVALSELATYQRLLRSDMLVTLREDFIEAATSRGLSRRYVLWRHALRPSSFSLITVAGISTGRLIGGTVIVETLFALPGIGQLLVEAIKGRDVIVVQGIVALIVIGYVVINTAVDIAYGLLDPRVRRRVAV